MRHTGGIYTEPEHAWVDFIDAGGLNGHVGGVSTHGPIPYSLQLEPVLEGVPSPANLRVVDNTLAGNDESVPDLTSDTVSESTCGVLQPMLQLRRLPRQAEDAPYKTMVSFTKEVACPCKGYFLTRVGEKSAHVYLAVLLLRQSFDSI
jgi:hypothetical protein